MIETVSPDSSHYQRVIELGNANSRTLGFLPYAAIKDAAEGDGVLAFVEDGVVQGYALFGKRRRTGDISLTHLCVDGSQRGRGIARNLVEGIVEHYPQRAGIRLSCRKDYPANEMWPKLGFERWGEIPGRRSAGSILVVWWREIAAPSLFGKPEQEPRTVVAVDTNILLDILDERDFPGVTGTHGGLDQRIYRTGHNRAESLGTGIKAAPGSRLQNGFGRIRDT